MREAGRVKPVATIRAGRPGRLRTTGWVAAALILTGVCLAQQQPQGPLIANLPAQDIGPNDLINVSVYDAPELSRTVRVSSEGQIRLPMLEEKIDAQGLQPAELEERIAKALEKEEILNKPFVTVTIAEYHSRPISVAGAVKEPLVFQATTPVKLLEAIARAGGLNEFAGTEILVSRGGKDSNGKSTTVTQRIPVRGLIDAADPELNLTLTGGEEVRVPEASKIYVVGNVRRPGAFPVQDGRGTTVLQLLALTEGLAPYASKDAFVYRRDADGGKSEIEIPLSKIMDRKEPDVPLVANDILYIPDNKGKRLTMGTLERILGFGTTVGAGVIIYGNR